MSVRAGFALCGLAVVPAVTLATGASAAAVSPRAGLVVETVGRQSASEQAGLRPGDVLSSWRSGSSSERSGVLHTPFDLEAVEVEEAPRGPVTVSGTRDGSPFSLTLAPRDWTVDVRPVLAGPLATRFAEAEAVRRAEPAKAVELLRTAPTGVAGADLWLTCWLQARAAQVWFEAGDPVRGHEVLAEAVSSASRAGDKALAASLLEAQASRYESARDLPKATAALRQAVQAREEVDPESLALALALYRLGRVVWTRGELAEAWDLLDRSLAIRDKRAPDSLPVAKNLTALGNIANWRGDRALGEPLFARALAISQRLAPGSSYVAVALAGLGGTAYGRGEWAEAERFFLRVLEISERHDPEGAGVGSDLGNLAAVASERGDLVKAERLFRRALAIRERLTPGDHVHARTLANLGLLAWARGDLDEADRLHREALGVFEKISTESLDVARVLVHLGDVALARGDGVAAGSLYARALAIEERLVPDSRDHAELLLRLADAQRARGDHAAAEAAIRRSLAIAEGVGPGSFLVARCQRALGDLARSRGDWPRVEALYREALAIHERVAPYHQERAETHHALGVALAQRNRREEAAAEMRTALDVLEGQAGRLGGAEEVQTGFAARFSPLYRDALELAFDLGRGAEAFEVLERSRARVLLAMLSQRDLQLGEVPEALERERRQVEAEYRRVQTKLGAFSGGDDPKEGETLGARLRDLRARRAEIATRVREAAPRVGALRDTRPLDLAAARRALDPGTLLLSYSVGRTRTLLFAVGGGEGESADLSVFDLPLGEEAMRARVEGFRRLLSRVSPAERGRLDADARRLYDDLLGPTENRLASATRLLICPDGPLHQLPFGALRRRAGYLAEWKPIHLAVSATVYDEVRRARPSAPRASLRLLAFGDPAYPLGTNAGGAAPLERLPGTRREIAGIAGVLGSDVRSFMGTEATESRARSLGSDVRYLHFACHARLNERFPLSSGLALTPPEVEDAPDDGLLQAWEIIESVRLEAELVTLSACETALGADMGGEGLMGLTRAFLFAGARSVVASLWQVSDETTADLMERFYKHLAAGEAKDSALRAAQIEMIRAGGRRGHPFRWAAFQVFGDWR